MVAKVDVFFTQNTFVSSFWKEILEYNRFKFFQSTKNYYNHCWKFKCVHINLLHCKNYSNEINLCKIMYDMKFCINGFNKAPLSSFQGKQFSIWKITNKRKYEQYKTNHTLRTTNCIINKISLWILNSDFPHKIWNINDRLEYCIFVEFVCESLLNNYQKIKLHKRCAKF